MEAVEAAAAEVVPNALAPATPGRSAHVVSAMWAVLRGELEATSEQVERELAALDQRLEELDVSG